MYVFPEGYRIFISLETALLFFLETFSMSYRYSIIICSAFLLSEQSLALVARFLNGFQHVGFMRPLVYQSFSSYWDQQLTVSSLMIISYVCLLSRGNAGVFDIQAVDHDSEPIKPKTM